MYQINSRIIIDTYAWNRFQPNNSVSVSHFARQTLSHTDEHIVDGGDLDYDGDFDSDEDDSGCYNESRDANFVHRTDVADAEKIPSTKPLTKDQLLLCTTILKGYSLKEKKWRK